MKVRDIKNAVVDSDIEEETFSDIVNINEEEEITREELEEILGDAEPYELASNHIDDGNENLLDWYLEDIERLYNYANESGLFSTNDVIEILQDGQRIYWEEQISQMLDKLSDFLNNHKDDEEEDDGEEEYF